MESGARTTLSYLLRKIRNSRDMCVQVCMFVHTHTHTHTFTQTTHIDMEPLQEPWRKSPSRQQTREDRSSGQTHSEAIQLPLLVCLDYTRRKWLDVFCGFTGCLLDGLT